MWSLHKGSSLPLLPPDSFPLLQHGLSSQAAFLQEKNLVHCVLSMGHSPSRTSPLALMWVFHGLQWILALVWAPHHGLWGSICSGTWSSSSSDLGVPSAVSHSFCSLPFYLCGVVCSSLTVFSPRATILAEGLSCVLLWVFWIWMEPPVSSTGQPPPLLTKATLAAPPLPTLCHRPQYSPLQLKYF